MNILKRKLIKINKIVLDLFFPSFCVGCQKEGSWLCQECFKKIIRVTSPVCPECGRLSPGGKYCPKCQKGKFLKGIICACHYEEGPVKEAVHNFKYNSVTSLAPVLGRLMSQALRENLTSRDFIIVFVPLHPRRQAQRGYNQAEILAKEVERSEKYEVRNLLMKTKNTQRQVGLIGPKRRKNLSGAFQLKEEVILKGKTIILIDDITTTGATLNECAKVLKKSGAKEIWGLVVARG